MIGFSMLLVIVAAVALVAGLFAGRDLTLIWFSIAACLTAGLFLLIGVLRLRPRNRTAPPERTGSTGGTGSTEQRMPQQSWPDAGATATGDHLDRTEFSAAGPAEDSSPRWARPPRPDVGPDEEPRA